jgi:Zn-dependent alcohol dehydrogenase
VIHGAGGGVGTALLQLARVLGLRAIGTERAAKLELVRELGATVIDYQRGDVAARVRELCPAGADMVLDPIGGEHAARSYADRQRPSPARRLARGTAHRAGHRSARSSRRDPAAHHRLEFEGVQGKLVLVT